MIYSLVILKLGELIWQHALSVVPIYVPVGGLIISQLKSQLLHSLFDDSIATLGGTEEKLLGFLRFLGFFLGESFSFAVRRIARFLPRRSSIIFILLSGSISFPNVRLCEIIMIECGCRR